VGICVSEIAGERELREWLAVRNELEPDEPWLLEQLLARREAEPARRDLVAKLNGEHVGVGSVGPKGSRADLAYGYIGVPDAWKRRGVESALLDVTGEIARREGRTRLELWAHEDDLGLIGLLAERGFHEVMREAGLASEIAEAPIPERLPLPPGISLCPVALEPSLGRGAYEVAEQAWRDIPGETGIEAPEAWLRLNVEDAPGGAVVALHKGRVVGFAGLHRLAGEGLYEHGLIAVHADYRRRGIARAMKLSQLQWLREHGARRVVTWNAETNLPARSLNLSLGYRPLPASIAFQGPI
jgi:GNAT superfamily N-acetyltransferase